MSADIAISVGISSEPAKVGRDEILSFGNDIVAMYARITQAQKEQASQAAGAGLQGLREQKTAAEDVARTYDRAAAEIMAGDARRMASAKALADAGDRAAAAIMLAEQRKAEAAQKSADQAEASRVKSEAAQAAANDRATASIMAGELRRAEAAERALQRVAAAQSAQNAQYMRTDAAAQSFSGYMLSGASARDSAYVFQAQFAAEEQALLAREKAANAVMAADIRRAEVAQKAANDDVAAADRAAAALMASEQRREQAAQKAAAEQQQTVARLTGTYAPYAAELQRLAKDEALINSLRSAGALDSKHAELALSGLHAKQAAATVEMNRMAAGAKLTGYEMRNLSYQINDVVSGLAMGQSPMMILTQQGGQFVQIFQQAGISMGGVALGIGAVAVAAIALVAPLARLAEMNQEARTLDLTLRAVGNTANVSGAYLQKLAEQTAKISMSSRADVTAAFSAITSDQMGRGLSPDQIQKLTLAAEGYATVTGKTLPDAANALMKAVTGGFDSMAKLSAQFPLATKAELENLRVMSLHGDTAGVVALEIELLNRKFSGLATQGASESQKAIHGLTAAWDEFLTSASKSNVVVGALEAMTAAMRGLSDEIKNAPSQLLALLNPSTQLVELAKLYANGKGWSQMGNSPMLSMPMPPPLAANQNDGKGGVSGSVGTADDAFSAKTNAIMAAAHAQAAAYDLVGVARQRALVSAQFDQQIIAAGADLEKVAEARAQKRAALLMVDAQARGQTVEMIDSLKRQTAAQQELNTAIGRGYEARKRAEIENAVAAEKFKNPGMGAAQEAELRRDLARKEEARRAGEEFTDLQTLQDSAKYENMLADARLRGAEALRLANVEIETQKRLEKYGGNQGDIRKAVNDNSLAQQRSELASKASGLSATLQSKQEMQDLDLVISKMRELGATSDEIAQVYQNAEIRKLEATQDWADGAQASLMRYQQNASNYGAMAGNAVSSGMRSMENALVSFSSKTMTAAQAFKSMASSIIQDLIRMQVQAQITGPLSKALSGLWSSGGATTASDSQLQSNYAGFYSQTYAPVQVDALPARASGGPVSAGTMYQVNEIGREMFVPNTDGFILNANDTAAALSPKAANANERTGGNVVQITNYVEAGASMADVEAAVASGISQAAPFIVNSAVQQSVPMAVSATKNRVQRAGGVDRWSR